MVQQYTVGMVILPILYMVEKYKLNQTDGKSDYENYSPLVRKGGIITFHDIDCSINKEGTEWGQKTKTYSGMFGEEETYPISKDEIKVSKIIGIS